MQKAIAPGKLILSGEHAVVYGQPCLAIAVNRYASAWAKPHPPFQIGFELLNLDYHKQMTFSALKKLKGRLHESYEEFLAGRQSIRDVLKLPYQLSTYAVSHLLEKLNHSLDKGVHLSTHSDIPLGCGMGSSASMILAVMHALALQQGLTLSSEDYFEHAQETEHLQHGRSSGIDLRVSLHGGGLYYHQGKMEKRPLPDFPLWIINTGTPLSSTGECVATLAPTLENPTLLADFQAITLAFDQALQQQNLAEIQRCAKENQYLLAHVGVVPLAVQELIQTLGQHGIVGKVCGAGAVRGEQAGVILLWTESLPSHLPPILARQIQSIKGDELGLRSA